MRWSWLLAVLLISCSPHRALAPWQRSESILLAAYLGCQAYDTLQTLEGLEHGYPERNPLFGRHPSPNLIVAAKSATAYGIYRLADAKPQQRRWILAMPLALCTAVIQHNHQLGVRVQF